MIKIKICIIKEILHWGGFCQLTIKDVNEYKDFFFSKYSVIFLLLCYFETISCVFVIIIFMLSTISLIAVFN